MAGTVTANRSSTIQPPDLTPVPFASMVSACTDPAVCAASRVDPYWHGLWVGGSQASWLSRAVAERREQAGFERIRSRDRVWTPERAREVLLRSRSDHRYRRLAALATISMWRTVTQQQLAAFTGPGDTKRVWNDTTILWAAGITERGTVVTERPSNLPKLFRLTNTNTVDELLNDLTFAEWVAVTAGQPVTSGPQHDRHNILTTEFALRVAEYCEIGTVLGEALCGRHHFDPTTSTPTGIDAGDCALVRTDGLRIMVEITAHTSKNWRRKVDRWVDVLMDQDPDDDPGLLLLFVEASSPDRRDPNEVWRTMRRGIEAAVLERPGAVRRGIHERVAAARWRWWFPEPMSATVGFTTLECHRPTGPVSNRWELAHLLDVTDVTFNPNDSEAATAVLDHARMLWGTPHWLRGSRPADWSGVLCQRAGVPVPSAFDPTVEFSKRVR